MVYGRYSELVNMLMGFINQLFFLGGNILVGLAHKFPWYTINYMCMVYDVYWNNYDLYKRIKVYLSMFMWI